MKKGILCFLTALLLASCGAEKDDKGISEETVQSLLAEVKTADKELLERGGTPDGSTMDRRRWQ